MDELSDTLTLPNPITHPKSSCPSRGIDLVRAEVIPDDVADIRSTLLRLKEIVGAKGIVFTSGGIGPTHDDVTYEAVAAATGRGTAWVIWGSQSGSPGCSKDAEDLLG